MKEDTGQILIVDKIVNNNIVIAKDFRGREVVAIGKGVGFRKRKNEAVHRSEIMKTYVLLDKVDSGVLTLFEEIQFEVIETSQKIIDYAQEKLNVKFNVNLLMSLSDHINFALIQYRQGNHVPKLVNEEVKRFYNGQYQIILGEHLFNVYDNIVKNYSVETEDAIDENLDEDLVQTCYRSSD